jgi:hypothetical protein
VDALGELSGVVGDDLEWVADLLGRLDSSVSACAPGVPDWDWAWTLVRLFPDWFWKMLNAPYQITTGLGWHFLFMWIFAVNGIAYAIYLAVSGEWRVLVAAAQEFCGCDVGDAV